MAELSEKYVKTSESHLIGQGKFVSILHFHCSRDHIFIVHVCDMLYTVYLCITHHMHHCTVILPVVGCWLLVVVTAHTCIPD